MDIKEAVEVSKGIRLKAEEGCLGFSGFTISEFTALQTLIDYCSEPKVELEEKALVEFLFQWDKDNVGDTLPTQLAQAIVSHFKLSVPSVVSKKDISNIIYAWEGKHYPISSLTDSIYRLFMKGKTHEK